MSLGLAHLSVECLNSVASLVSLRAEWHDLLQRCPSATPFQTPEWLIPWWTHFGQGQLCTLTLRRYGQLVGLAPFYCTTSSSGAERLLLLGTGISDHLDLLCDWRCRAEVAGRVLTELPAVLPSCRTYEFYNVPSHAALLSAPVPRGWADDTGFQTSSPVLPLIGVASHCVPAIQWKRLQRCRRRAARIGAVRLVTVDDDSFNDLFSALLRLHALRWRSAGSSGVLAQPALREFHRAAARGLLQRGQLCLYTLSVDDVCIAALYGYRHRGSVYLYLSGFDPRAAALSPGVLIMGAVIEHAQVSGVTMIEFLTGREAYKYAWGAQDQMLYSRRIAAPVGGTHACETQLRAAVAVGQP